MFLEIRGKEGVGNTKIAEQTEEKQESVEKEVYLIGLSK